MKTWLVLDVHYLCHRAFHAMGNLSFNGSATGVIYGFLQTLRSLQEELGIFNVAFCFEHPILYRRKIEPTYKQRRVSRVKTPEEQKAYKAFAQQIVELRTRYLPKIGYRNIFCSRGMESDDLMAAIAFNTRNHIVLVTSDRDLYQCLRPNVTIFDPRQRKLITKREFSNVYGIRPNQWAVVKAIAGCHSDEVKGIKGIGEVTALKFIRKELDSKSAAFKKISAGSITVLRNRILVKLPFVGCPVPVLKKDKFSQAGWYEVCSILRMNHVKTFPNTLKNG